MLVGYQAVFDKDFFDAVSFAAKHHFDYVQFDLNVPRYYLDGLNARELDRIRKTASDNAVGLSFHAPGDNVSLFSDFPAVRDGLLRQMHLILRRANDLGARHLTVHPGSPPSFRKAGQGDDDYRSEYWSYYGGVLADNLRWLAERAGTVAICVENFGRVDLAFEAIGPLLGTVPEVFLCWDFAKSQCQPEAEAFFRTKLEHVREVHVHDFDRDGHQHGAVGNGTMDFGRHAALIARDDVATTIEVRPREAALESKHKLLQILSAARAHGPG